MPIRRPAVYNRNTRPAASAPNSESFRRKYPNRGITDETTSPISTALRTDFQCVTGFRLLNLYLDRERVIITARRNTVRFDLRSASSVSEGKTPAKFVRRAVISAIDIMNALLPSSALGVMRSREHLQLIYR